jgi:hypothetical protein
MRLLERWVGCRCLPEAASEPPAERREFTEAHPVSILYQEQ